MEMEKTSDSSEGEQPSSSYTEELIIVTKRVESELNSKRFESELRRKIEAVPEITKD